MYCHFTFLPQCKYVEQSSMAYAIKTYIFILIIIYILTFDVKVIMVFNLICNKYYSFTHKTFMHKLNN